MHLSLLLLACAGGLGATASVDPDVPTVVTVAWEADGDSYVEYGPTAAYGMVTPTQAGTAHNVPLYGLAPDAEVHWRAVTVGVGEDEGVAQTGGPGPGFPSISVTVDEPGRSEEGYWFGALFEFLGHTPRIGAFDRTTGALVWFYQGTDGMTSVDAQFVAGSNDVYFNQFNASFSVDNGNIRRVTLGGDVVGEWYTPLAHHMFAQLPDGKVAFQSLDTRTWTDPETGETDEVASDAVMELDPTDGSTVEVFNVWDWLEPTWNRHWDDLSIYPGVADWTHGNAIKYTPDTDGYLLSLGHANTLIDFGRSDGQLREMYGAEGVPVAADSLAFDYQHDPTWTEAGTLTMFTTNLDAHASGAIEYALRDGELHEVWSHDVHDGDLQAIALGQVTRLENGNTLVAYGAEGVMREVDPDGAVVWEAVSDQGFGNGHLVGDFYAP